MKRKLKTAFELSQERVISPRWRPFIEDEYKPESYIPDFVTDWKHPDGDAEDDGIVFVDNPDYLYKTEQDVFSEHTNETLNNMEINMQPPEHIVFDAPRDQVKWCGDFLSYSSMGRLNRAMAFGLSDRAVFCKCEIHGAKQEVNDATLTMLEHMQNNKLQDGRYTQITGALSPISELNNSEHNILYTAVPATDTISSHFIESIQGFDEIWVPTHYTARVLKDNGITLPVSVLPWGVDTDRYKPGIEAFRFPELRDFVFLSVFKWNIRKGYDILLKSYLELFTDRDDVTLLLVCNGADPDRVANKLEEAKQEIDADLDNLPHIVLYNLPIKEWCMPHVYASADAYVLPSRGEFFGLTYCEASSCGLPVIGSCCTGQSDYLTPDNSYLIYPNEIIPALPDNKLHEIVEENPEYEGNTFADFHHRGIRQLQNCMCDVYRNYSEALEKSEKLRQQIITKFNWNIAVDNVCKKIRQTNRR